MKPLNIIILCIGICLLSGILTYWRINEGLGRIAVADAVKLCNEFALKKEMEASEEIKLRGLSRKLDSLRNAVQVAMQLKKGKDEVEPLLKFYDSQKDQLEQEYERSNRDINSTVWKRLNALIDSYGKEKGYRVIIGANGMGSILYMDQYYDITGELIKYVNKKYAEGS